MLKYHREKGKIIAGELISNELIISDVQDILDLIAEAGSNECRSLIIPAKNLDERFFDLKTGVAGEILQKFSNYRVRLAITGDFKEYKSRSLHDFIRESNRGDLILFCDDVKNAVKKFENNILF